MLIAEIKKIVEIGDYIDIDNLEEELTTKGYSADYVNLETWSTGRFAVMYVSEGNEKIKILVSSEDLKESLVVNIEIDEELLYCPRCRSPFIEHGMEGHTCKNCGEYWEGSHDNTKNNNRTKRESE